MTTASALTLGRVRGAALIGRPLNVSIPVTLSEGEGACFDAELYFGETRTEKPALQWEPGAEAPGQLRLLTRQALDEPMVTLYLTAGCQNRVTRRYVMLSEQPPDSEPAPRGPFALPAAAPVVPAADPRPARAASSATGTQPAAAKPRPDAVGSAKVRVAPERKPAVRAPQAPRPRLTLEAPDVEPSDPRLRLDTGLRAEPTTDGRTRQQAAALWRAINTTPEQAVREADRLRALESDVADLKDSSRQTAAALTLMVEQLEKARRERNQLAMILLVFGGVVVLGGAVGAWWWQRRRLQGPGQPWHAVEAHSVPQTGGSASGEGFRAVQPPLPAGLADVDAATPREGSGLHEPSAGEGIPRASVADDPLQPAARQALPPLAHDLDTMGRLDDLATTGFAPSLGSARVVGVEELMGIEDKAAFFVSIGQPDQAMAVLESHVHDEVETSALPWLDLLKLYHTFGRRDDYERLRLEFIAQFNAEVPRFDAFTAPTEGLQAYPRALSRIVSLWPEPRVLEVIEESIFRKPDAPGAEAFSLEAYRELLLLYHLACEIVPRPSRAPHFRSTEFSATALEPLSAGVLGAAGPQSGRTPLMGEPSPPILHLADLDLPDLDIPAAQIPPASPRLGLDVDLAEIESEEVGHPAVEAQRQTVLAPDLTFDLEWEAPELAAQSGPDRKPQA